MSATPYYTGRWATLYLGDCRDIAPTLERRSADLLIADPPYGVAAILAGRRFVGIELDERYAAIAVDRIQRAEKLADELAAA